MNTPFHPRYLDVLSKSHKLYQPIKDIVKNAGNLSELSMAIAQEADEEESSEWHLHKSVKYLLTNSLKSISEDRFSKENHFVKGIRFIKPLAKSIDSFEEIEKSNLVNILNKLAKEGGPSKQNIADV